jgi:hypothetical protein
MADRFPYPNTKGIAKTFWDGLKEGKFLVQHCHDCGGQIFYPRVVCHHCGGTNLSFREHSGEGEIYSFTVIHKNRHPAFKDKVPYVVAIVELAGGGRMMTNIVDCDAEDVKIGQKVKLKPAAVSEDVTLPYFTLA